MRIPSNKHTALLASLQENTGQFYTNNYRDLFRVTTEEASNSTEREIRAIEFEACVNRTFDQTLPQYRSRTFTVRGNDFPSLSTS